MITANFLDFCQTINFSKEYVFIGGKFRRVRERLGRDMSLEWLEQVRRFGCVYEFRNSLEGLVLFRRFSVV